MTTKPEKLGKYKIVSVLGEGSMGVVYKAIDPDIQEYVAIKAIHKKLLEGKDRAVILQRFINEVKAGRLLRHPNIVAMYDYQEDEDVCFLVMEYVEGTTLKDVIQDKHNLASNEICDIMNQLLDGLEVAHKHGVIHRDVKPENLILKDNGDVRIADFGVARLDSSTMTTDGSILGSPSYMSPEQCMGKQVDARSDLFSAGVVLYQMLTGQKPFSGMAFMETMQQILYSQPAMPSTLNSAIDSDWDNLVKKALAKHVDERFQTAADFQQALKSIEGIENENQQSKGARWLPWLLSAGVLAGIIGGGYYWLKMQPAKINDLSPNRSPAIIDQPQIEGNDPEVIEEAAIPFDQQLKQLLEKFACDGLSKTANADNTVTVSGYISKSRDTAFREAASNLAERSQQQLNMDLMPLLNENCEALTLLQPFVENNISKKHGLQIEAYQHGSVFVEGERPVFEIITPDYPGYLYVDYFMTDGKVFHLLPGADQAQELYKEQQQVLIGNYGTTRQWQIVEPYGKEIMSVIVSDKPLFATKRQDIEATENYLLDLRLALSEPNTDVIVADTFIITTISQTEAVSRADL